MNRSATVHSIDAIREFRAALAEFCHEARSALVDVDLELRRSREWILEVQPAYWAHQIRVRDQQVLDAKNDLHRARLRTLPGGELPSCIEERRAVERAQVRLADAREKIDLLRRWARVEQHETDEYKARASQLMAVLDAAMPRALAFLDQRVVALDAYVAAGQPERSTVSAAHPEPTADDLPAASQSAEAPASKDAVGAPPPAPADSRRQASA